MLHVVVLPATGHRDGQRAQYDLEGGPGFAVTDFLDFYAGEGAAYREKRDIVLADMRGTGRSNPLRCSSIEESQKRQPMSPLYPADLVADCALQLRGKNDVRQYNTGAAAHDIELVRRALGYEQLDINAISYGTTLALRYIAEYPTAVHAAVLTGTVPANRTPPRFHAVVAQGALAKLASECAMDARCRENGDLRANLLKAQERVTDEAAMPVPVFLEKLRNILYSSSGRAEFPYLVAEAAKGNLRAFTRTAAEGRVFADGLYLSITCTESFARMDVESAIAAARATTFGAYRLERQRDACRHWPRGKADPNLMREPMSPVPVLFIAGEQDPVSPPEWAEEVAAHFSKGTLIRVPHGAHIVDGLSGLDTCLDAAVIQYFDTAALQDTSCFAQMMPPPLGVSVE